MNAVVARLRTIEAASIRMVSSELICDVIGEIERLERELADCQENRSQERADAAEDNLHLSQHLEKAEEDLRAMRLRAEAAEARNNQEEGQ